MTVSALAQSLLGAAGLSAKLVLIIVPLVTLFELLRHMSFFRKAGRAAEPLVTGVGLAREAATPLFAGIFLGVTYGAGIIIRVSRERSMPRRELFLMGLFLATCHAVVEDTLIFVAIGGNGAAMLGTRIVIAVLLTALLSRLWKPAAPPSAGP